MPMILNRLGESFGVGDVLRHKSWGWVGVVVENVPSSDTPEVGVTMYPVVEFSQSVTLICDPRNVQLIERKEG